MKELLLREKRRHGLPEIINKKEEELLKINVPIQKIMGFINFDDVRINVNRNVLIPRYETEEVMKESLKYITKDSKILDLCTGSGYIGLSIKKKTNAHVIMSDISDESIIQSKENANLNNLKVDIIKSNMFENINEKFDLIISNPPYIPQKTLLKNNVLKYEPHNALFGGIDGNDFYKIIVKNMNKFLKPNGIVILEISQDNTNFLIKNKFKIKKDINNKERIAIYKKQPQ